jgi:hypothetical protein
LFSTGGCKKLPGEGITASAMTAKATIPRIIIFLIKKLSSVSFFVGRLISLSNYA